ncbi:MAG: histidine triad family protein [Actinomycetota bacterium]|nr:histidine triad family protein [Actinomycetota bacterium]
MTAASSEPCLFCRIIAGEVPADVVLDTPAAFAFLDHRPVFKGHTLVVPRTHVVTLTDLPAASVGPFFVEVQRVARAVVEGLGADGTFVAMNNVVSQAVAHLHVHVVPRRRKDGLRGFFWPRQKYDPGESATYAASIAAAFRPVPS